MRVLHFYKAYHPHRYGGVEKVIAQLVSSTARHGVQNEVLTIDDGDPGADVPDHGQIIHRMPCNFRIASTDFSFQAIRSLRALAPRFDVIHYHFPWPFMDLAHFMARVNVPTVVTYHSDIVRQKHWLRLYRPLMHRFLGCVDRIVATSPNYIAHSEVLQRHRDKCRVIPIGLDPAGYLEPSAELLAHWRRRVGQKFFLFVGVLRYYKGLHVLLEALQGVDYPVAIVGSGPLECELRRKAAQLKLRNVLFLGALPEVDKVALLSLCYGFVFPSHLRSEAFGVSLLEAAMAGKPMISCEIGTGTSYINPPGEAFSLVVPPADPDALREAMTRLWHDAALADKLGQQAQQRFHQLFTADLMASRYAALYRELPSSVA